MKKEKSVSFLKVSFYLFFQNILLVLVFAHSDGIWRKMIIEYHIFEFLQKKHMQNYY